MEVNGVKPVDVLCKWSTYSIMGPLLFFISINNVVSVVTSSALLFVDDVKIFCPIFNGLSALNHTSITKNWEFSIKVGTVVH